MNLYRIEKQLVRHEGERLDLYQCPAEKWTIGVGHNLDAKGITKEVSRFILQGDIRECVEDLQNKIFPGQFDQFPEDIQHVVIDMRFQLGRGGFRMFKKMIASTMDENWPEMIEQMKDSAWYGQVPERAESLINMVLNVQNGKYEPNPLD